MAAPTLQPAASCTDIRCGELATERTLAASLPTAAGTIDIELSNGARMRITGSVDPGTISAAVAALARSERRRFPFPAGVQVWPATGHTDMRKGFDGHQYVRI
jgi:hypothetical protein